MTEPMLQLPFNNLDKETVFKFAKKVLQDDYPQAFSIKIKHAAFPCVQGDSIRLTLGSGHADYEVLAIKRITSCAVNPLLEVNLRKK